MVKVLESTTVPDDIVTLRLTLIANGPVTVLAKILRY
jgi:hypothetical protein